MMGVDGGARYCIGGVQCLFIYCKIRLKEVDGVCEWMFVGKFQYIKIVQWRRLLFYIVGYVLGVIL